MPHANCIRALLACRFHPKPRWLTHRTYPCCLSCGWTLRAARSEWRSRGLRTACDHSPSWDAAGWPNCSQLFAVSLTEGWSADAQWTGVRIADLLALVQAHGGRARVTSLQTGSAYATSVLDEPHVRDPATLLALRLNGEPLALDHGYPARLIAPNRPGVLQTKWVATISVDPG